MTYMLIVLLLVRPSVELLPSGSFHHPAIHSTITKIHSTNPSHTIIHLKDYHYIPFDHFKKDFRANDAETHHR